MKIKINRLLNSNKAAFIFSLILSFCIWVKLSTSSSEKITKTITNIPIIVSLSESAKEAGLVVFGLDDLYAEVTVSGNRITLGQLTKDDITVFAQQSAGIINTTGNYTLELSAKKNSRISNYEILDKVFPRSVNVMVDRLQSKKLNIEQNITCKTDQEHIITAVTLSEPEITVTGPESIVSDISRVLVEKEIKDILVENTSIKDLPLSLYDSGGKKITTTNLTFSTNKVDATISILSRKTVNITPVFLNKPQNFILNKNRISLDCTKLEIAANKEILGSINEIQLEPLDFSSIDLNSKEFNLPLKLPNGVMVLSDVSLVNLKLNTEGMQEKQVKVNNISFINASAGQNAVPLTKNITVEIIGPYNEIRNIKSENLCAEIDLLQKENFKGILELPVNIKIALPSSCWVYGKYNATVQIS